MLLVTVETLTTETFLLEESMSSPSRAYFRSTLWVFGEEVGTIHGALDLAQSYLLGLQSSFAHRTHRLLGV